MALISKDEYAKIPEDIHRMIRESAAQWEDLYNVLTYAVRALVYGPPGTGKSSACATYDLGVRPLERLAITQETCSPQILGCYGIGSGNSGMVWLDGPIARAWKNGGRLHIDEINEAGGDTIPTLHMATDDNAIASITMGNGETIRPKEGFQCFATMNTLPSALPEALADRFVIKREITKPNPRMLFKLPPVLIPAASYSLYGTNTDRIVMSSRSWIELGRLMLTYGLNVRDALAVVVGPKKAKDAALAVEVASTKQQNAAMAANNTAV